MEQKVNNMFTEDSLLKLFFQRHAKSLIKEALLEFMRENELAIITTKEPSPPSQLLTTQEVAKYFNVNRHGIYMYMKDGLPSIKIGKTFRFRMEDVQKYVKLRAKG